MTWVTLVPRVTEPGRVVIFQCAECERLDFNPRKLGGGRLEGTTPAAMGDAADPFRRNAEECRQLEHFSIRLGVSRVCEISFAFFFGNPFEKRGDCSPKLLNCARLHFA